MNYEQMKTSLIKACDSYYNKSFSLMSDSEFDKLKDEFTAKYPEDPFLKTIGSPVSENSHWKKFKHDILMSSCNKCNIESEFTDWAYKNHINEVVISEKLDGISLNLVYINGKLEHAVTRGAGDFGEDIIRNVVRMQNVKEELPIPYTGSLRAEVMMKKEDLRAVNFLQEVRGEKAYQNVRNSASGIATNESGQYSEYLFLQYYYANVDYYTGDSFKTKMDMYKFIEKDLGLESCKHFFGNMETAKVVYLEYENDIRAKLNHEIDGLVIEANDLELQKSLGLLNENPRGQIAWKFTSEKQQTKVKDVVFQLGNSGRLTPVLIMEPVFICGVTVRKATVHNYEMFMNFNLHKDDIVLIERKNDVIPYILNNLSNHPSNERGEKLKVPSKCPACGESVKVDGVFLICDNPECSGGKLGDLNKWAKKLELKGVASATLEKLYEAELIEDPSDLYTLKFESIAGLPGFGESSAETIIQTLNEKKEITFPEMIAGLNIPNFSGKTAELLEKNEYETYESILEASNEELSSIKGIGMITSNDIIEGLKKKVEVIKKLFNNGITIKRRKVMAKSNHPLAGKNVVFTGALEMKRTEAQAMVVGVGGICPSSISKDTDFLVIADIDSTSSKAQKARKYGTVLINEAQFMAYFN